MALVDSDLFLVQDATTKLSYRLTYQNFKQDLASNINLDSRYVKNDGDNMTGTLTLGPEGDIKITLNPANGNGEFAGTVTGTFAGDGSQLINLPIPPGLWQLIGDNLSPLSTDSNITDVVDITASGTIEAYNIDGGVYS